jgi:hypothetical protein
VEVAGKGERQENRVDPTLIFMKNGMCPYFQKGEDHGFNRRGSRV